MNSSCFIITLLKCPGIGSTKALNYIVDNNFSLEKCITNIEKIIPKTEFDLYADIAKTEIELNKNKNIDIVTIFDSLFPSKLYNISDPVLYLYYFGNIKLLNSPSVAIIGTRHPSLKSISDTKAISKIISEKYAIVGGLALGIDTIAHQTAIDNKGKTIAVLPSSIDNIQPKSNTELAKRIAKSGSLLVSEYSSGTTLSKFNYAKRDRIQAALADTIIVPEANEDSGTMIAIRKAYKENKKVFQVLGNNNQMIKDTISLDDNYIKVIDDAVSKNQIIEKEKNKQYVNHTNNEQMSLF